MAENNFTLGRGELHFGKFRSGSQTPGGERYLGNSPELAFTAEQETLDHFNSDRGIRKKDASVVVEIGYNGNFILDDIMKENLAMFFLGEALEVTDSGGDITGENLGVVKAGLGYQLGTSASTPAGVRQVSSVVVNYGDGDTEAVEGTDYTVDLKLARITVLEGSALDGVEATVDYTVEESTRLQVISKSDTIEGSLRFIAYNARGENIDYFMPWVQLTPNGDFALKGDEWQQLPFNLEVLQKNGLESIYMDGRPYNPST